MIACFCFSSHGEPDIEAHPAVLDRSNQNFHQFTQKIGYCDYQMSIFSITVSSSVVSATNVMFTVAQARYWWRSLCSKCDEGRERPSRTFCMAPWGVAIQFWSLFLLRLPVCTSRLVSLWQQSLSKTPSWSGALAWCGALARAPWNPRRGGDDCARHDSDGWLLPSTSRYADIGHQVCEFTQCSIVAGSLADTRWKLQMLLSNQFVSPPKALLVQA